MGRNRAALLGMMILVLLAACAPQASSPTVVPQATATRAPTQTPQPTPTPLTRRTLPPSWTPVVPTPTIDFVPLARDATDVPRLCDGFAPDIERSYTTFVVNGNAEVYWTRIPTASLYRVRLYDPSGAIIFEADTPEDVFVFPENLLTQTELYAWEVFPMNENREQMCQPVGSIMIGTYLEP